MCGRQLRNATDLVLVVLGFELDGSEPNVLAVGVGLEGERKDLTGRLHVALGVVQ